MRPAGPPRPSRLGILPSVRATPKPVAHHATTTPSENTGLGTKRSHVRVMAPDLSDEETAALLREFDRIIDGDRYSLSPRIRVLTAIHDKLRPPPMRSPLPPLKTFTLPRAGRRRR
jgi:hypothetical protein